MVLAVTPPPVHRFASKHSVVSRDGNIPQVQGRNSPISVTTSESRCMSFLHMLDCRARLFSNLR